jgi:hypothetical protein
MFRLRASSPSPKDTDGSHDLRRNLITMPACADHNLAKSGDDEYFFWVLSTNLPANAIARIQVSTKLARAHQRRPALGHSILSSGEEVIVMDSQAGTKHEVVQVPLDGARFQKVLDLFALGLYRHHFGERWVGSIRVHTDFIAFEGAESPADIDVNRLILLDCAKKLFANEPKHGENPSVFWYQVHEPKGPLQCLMRFVFYDGCSATAFIGEGSG